MADYLQPFCTDLTYEQKSEMFAVQNSMIQIESNFPKNNIQTKCLCNEKEDMEHIYNCELLCEKKNEPRVKYNKIYDGNLKEQTK